MPFNWITLNLYHVHLLLSLFLQFHHRPAMWQFTMSHRQASRSHGSNPRSQMDRISCIASTTHHWIRRILRCQRTTPRMECAVMLAFIITRWKDWVSSLTIDKLQRRQSFLIHLSIYRALHRIQDRRCRHHNATRWQCINSNTPKDRCCSTVNANYLKSRLSEERNDLVALETTGVVQHNRLLHCQL